MARRSSFGSIVNKSINAMAREAARAHRAAVREEKARMREYARQEKLNNKINKIEEACYFDGKLQGLDIDFKSLKKEFSPSHKLLNLNYVQSFDKDVLCDVINFLKVGDRVQAINCLKAETTLTYNEIILFVSIVENNIYKFIKDNADCWFEDDFGEYEFEPIMSLFDIDSDVDYDTAKSEVTITCSPIDESETISSKDPIVLKKRINTTVEKLNKKWVQQFGKYHLDRENLIVNTIKESQISLLKYIISTEIDSFDYESLKDKSEFVSKLPKIKKPKLELIDLTKLSNELISLDENKPSDEKTEFLLWEKWLCNLWLKEKMDERRKSRFKDAVSKWEKDKESLLNEIEIIKSKNEEITKHYETLKEEYNKYLCDVDAEKVEFLEKQDKYNKSIDERIEKFNNKDLWEVEQYYKNSLMLSVYPIIWEKDIELSLNMQEKILTISYKLPSIDEIFDIEKINYTQAKSEYTVVAMKEKQLKQNYNDMLYQICLRTLYEIFSLDGNLDCIGRIAFNGNVTAIDKSMGKEKTACVMTIEVNKTDFENIELDNIEPKECFKRLNGQANSDLAALISVK